MAEKLADLLSFPIERCREALVRCDGDEDAATDYLLTNEDQPEEFWKQKTPDPVKIEFERWGDNLAKVDEETLSEIVAKCLETGTPFVDSSFPPEDSSLFFNPAHARKHWKCHDCNRDNPLPSDQVMESMRRQNPTSDQIIEFFQFIARTNPALAVAMQQTPAMATRIMAESFGGGPGAKQQLVCKFCGGKFPLGVIDSRPTQWLRPESIRDDVTAQYGAGAPWKLIRDSVRPDDVRQGAVGNCWFVGAVTILARQKPHLVSRLFPFNQEYSECGAYLVRLCKDGLWRNVIVDDSLPCNRNRALCYTTASRRQLWVPLLEKAAAKLSGCYEGMHSGTICEAFSLLTGSATERELLLSDLSEEDKEVLWARVVSGHSAGYLIGLACSKKPQGSSPSMAALHAAGLQAPHAYVLLDTREIEIEGSIVKLVQLGNPWGDRSPSTWNGAWGNQSSEFRKAVQVGWLPRLSNEFNSDGEFWMTWDDVINHFATIEICRTEDHDLLHEDRMQGWLPAVTGLGDMFSFETKTSASGKIRVELSLYQESNMVRESARGAVSTSVDIGFVVLDPKDQVVGFHKRANAPEVSIDVFLDPSTKYRIVPLSFANALHAEHRKVIVAVRACDSNVISPFVKLASNADVLRTALNGYVSLLAADCHDLLPGLELITVKDGSGFAVVCVNKSTYICAQVTVDAEESIGLTSTRSMLLSTDVIPPGKRAILSVLTHKQGVNQSRLAVRFSAGVAPPLTEESNAPPLWDGEESPLILRVHESVIVPRLNLKSIDELVRTNTDPKLFNLLHNLSMKKSETATRLRNEYIQAGIAPDEATQIANEEAEFIYLS
jgi:calpain-15